MLVIKLRAGAAFPVRVRHLSCSLTLGFLFDRWRAFALFLSFL